MPSDAGLLECGTRPGNDSVLNKCVISRVSEQMNEKEARNKAGRLGGSPELFLEPELAHRCPLCSVGFEW